MSERTNAARAALVTLFMRGIAARVPASKEKINAALDEFEAAVHETHTPRPLEDVLTNAEKGGDETPPDTAGASVADVVGTDANGSPIVAEIPPPPTGKPVTKAKSSKK